MGIAYCYPYGLQGGNGVCWDGVRVDGERRVVPGNLSCIALSIQERYP